MCVSQLFLHDNKNLLLSLSVDKVIKVWDIRMFRCVQTLQDEERHRPEDKVTNVYYNHAHNHIITTSNYVSVWDAKAPPYRVAQSHDFPVVSALYNKNFMQVVSVDSGGSEENSVVRVWDVETGASVFIFNAVRHVFT